MMKTEPKQMFVECDKDDSTLNAHPHGYWYLDEEINLKPLPPLSVSKLKKLARSHTGCSSIEATELAKAILAELINKEK